MRRECRFDHRVMDGGRAVNVAPASRDVVCKVFSGGSFPLLTFSASQALIPGAPVENIRFYADKAPR